MSHSSELIAKDIKAYLKIHENKDLLRFLTCGNVDDGKSTLIGRLLYDSKLIYEDQMTAIEKDSERFNTSGEAVDLALLVDGLQSEREQGITIDVAYRYFSTEKRKFIIADTPGHEQYTRNMATGASTCNLAIVIIDARHGIQTQTRRHSYICSLLGIKHIIVAINKMDLVGYKQDIYQKIKSEYRDLAQSLNVKDIRFVPISALKGDNVVSQSENMNWYPGSPLMKLLETVKVSQDINLEIMRFPVQYINRPNLNFRGVSGTLASGVIRVGDKVEILPSKKTSRIKSIFTYDGERKEVMQGEAITLTLEDEIDVSRGNTIVHYGQDWVTSKKIGAHVVWMGEDPMQLHREYIFKFAAKSSAGVVKSIEYKIDVNTYENISNGEKSLNLNEVAQLGINLKESVVVDEYENLPQTGAFIMIDRQTNITVGAGMVSSTQLDKKEEKPIYSQAERELNAYVRKHYPEWECKKVN